MTTLLASSTATGATATEGDVKTYLANLRTFMADLLGTDSTNKAAVQGLLGNILSGKVSKTGAYTVVAADRGKVIDCSGTWTLALAAAATLGDGFCFAVKNSGTGVITVDPNLSEMVDGALTKTISMGEMTIFYCDGASFSTIGSGKSGISAQVFTSAGTFTIPPGVTKLKVTVVGGGGGGCGGSPSRGNGGGGGGAAIAYLTGVTPGNTILVSAIGAGGAGGASNETGVTAGGTTSVSSGTQTISTISATGGGVGDAGTSKGGAGGMGSGGTINIKGGGGGAGGDVTGSPGGSSILGGGGNSPLATSTSVAPSGGAYGGGGAGGGGTDIYGAQKSSAGGAGAAGVVIFEW